MLSWTKTPYAAKKEMYSAHLDCASAACVPSLTENGKWMLDTDIAGITQVPLVVNKNSERAVTDAANEILLSMCRERLEQMKRELKELLAREKELEEQRSLYNQALSCLLPVKKPALNEKATTAEKPAAPKKSEVHMSDDIYDEICVSLRALRRARGLSREALSRETGVGTSVLRRIETGESTPRKSTARKLADYFYCTSTASKKAPRNRAGKKPAKNSLCQGQNGCHAGQPKS